MKKIFYILFYSIIYLPVFSQSDEVFELVKKGVELHDGNKFSEAIEVYKKALEIEPQSALVNYEIAFSYLQLQEYENVVKYSMDAIKANDKEILPLAYNLLGSALDYSGKIQESIQLFEKAIDEFGGDYLGYYNLALIYYKIDDYENAIKKLFNGIDNFPFHASSHMLLGSIMHETGYPALSALSFYYFLLLEAQTDRSKDAFTMLLEVLKEIDIEPVKLNDNINDYHNNFEIFYNQTRSFFNNLESGDNSDSSIFHDLYIPFFTDLNNSGHTEAFCRYISQTHWSQSEKWIKNNIAAYHEFVAWFENNY